MSNGLFMSNKEFNSLPQKEKLNCLYENQVKTLNAIGGYKFHQKIQYPWLATLTMALIFLIKTLVGGA